MITIPTPASKNPPGALAGLKILDASRLLPAALCTQMLAVATTSAVFRRWARLTQERSCCATATSRA